MATPTDGHTMETSGFDTSDPTMDTSGIVVSCVPMVPRCGPSGGGLPTNFKVTSGFGGIVENAKVNVNKLYLRQIFTGPKANQWDVIERNAVTGLGPTGVNNWAVYDGLGDTAKLVANGHGMHTHAGVHAGKWSNWFTLVFVDQRFKGSTLQVMGANDDNEENEWAIVGGTGKFAMARGIINRRVHSFTCNTITQELTIEFFCHMKEVVVPPPTEIPTAPKIRAPTMRGPWGGDPRGTRHEMGGKSRRLESVTINYQTVVGSLQFSYVDEDGQIRTNGPWGVSEGNYNKQIYFDPSEFVKQITGAGTGTSWLTQFKIVTNKDTYGPFGLKTLHPNFSFSYTVPENETVVGFFAETLNKFVTRIGLYTIPK